MPKVIDFTLRADIADLKSELSKVPGITDKEAKKMASAMEKGLQRAEKAAAKAAKSMESDLGSSVSDQIEKFRGLSGAIGISEEAFNSMQESAAKTAGQVEAFGDQLGTAGSSLSALGGALGHVNPELAEMAQQGADAMGAVEGVIAAARGGPIVFAAMAISVGIMYAATKDLSEAAAEYEAINQKRVEREEKIHKALAIQEQLTVKTARAYGLFTGEIKEFDVAMEDSNEAIRATAAQLIRLQKNKPNYHAIKEQINNWADAQMALNQRIRDTSAAQAAAVAQGKVSHAQNLALSLSASLMAESTKYADKTILAETAHMAFLDSTVQSYLATQQAAITATFKEVEGNETRVKSLEMSNHEYKMQMHTVDSYAKSVEKSTGRMFRVLDYRGTELAGNLGDLRADWQHTGRTTRDNAIAIQDMATGQFLTLEQLVALNIQAGNAARAESKARREAARATAQAEKEARDQQIQSMLEAVSVQAETGLEQTRLAELTSEAKLDELERRAVAEIDLVEAQLKERELLTLEAEETLGKARQDIADNFALQRKAAEADTAEEVLSVYEQLAAELEQVDLTGPITSEENVAAMRDLRATAAAMRSEFKAAGEEIGPAVEAQLQGLEALADLADGIPKWLQNYSQGLSEAQIKFDTVWSQIGDQVEAQGEHLNTFFSGVEEGATVLAEHLAEGARKRAMQVFRIQQGAAMSQAVISGALAIAKVTEQLGVFAPVAIAGVVASTAAQVATIAAEQPSFDTGGIIGTGGGSARTPDQVVIRALPGEAVLNRQAADRLGPAGVDRLNAGGGPEVVVRPVSTFKHFDRFTKAEFRRDGYFRSLFDQDREFAPGQRRY